MSVSLLDRHGAAARRQRHQRRGATQLGRYRNRCRCRCPPGPARSRPWRHHDQSACGTGGAPSSGLTCNISAESGNTRRGRRRDSRPHAACRRAAPRAGHTQEMLLHVGAVPAERDQPFDRTVRVDAVGLSAGKCATSRGAGRRDHGHVATRGRHPDELGRPADPPKRRGRFLQSRARRARPRCARRSATRRGCSRARPASVSCTGVRALVVGDLHDLTAGRLVPGDLGDRLAVGRPGRVVLADLGRGHPARRAVGQIRRHRAGRPR